MLQIEVDYEVADKIIVAGIGSSIEDLTKQVEDLSTIEYNKLKPYQVEDLNYCIDMLVHLKAVYDYYGGNLC